MTRLYLDNASTSYPKAPGVADAVHRSLTQISGTPGRASHADAREGARLIRQCRERLNRLLNGQSPDHIVFTLNTTDALNLAIKGVVAHRRRENPGGHVHLVTSVMDHNSVLRPFNSLARDGVEWTCIPCDGDGFIDPADMEGAIRPDTALVALSHASNVTGSIQPAAAVSEICRRRGVLFLLDAAQSLGHIAVDAQSVGADMIAFAGHKGLLGPLGTGGLFIRPGVEALVDTIREGGTGTESENDVQPLSMPDKYEAGSPNAPGIAGLGEGVKWLLDRAASDGFSHERKLARAMLDGMRSRGVRTFSQGNAIVASGPLSRFRLLGPADPARRMGVFSLVHDNADSHELAAVLESGFGVFARAGLHCAPRAHDTMGSSRGGALRLSLGPFLALSDVATVCDALSEVAASFDSLERPIVRDGTLA